MDDRQFLRARGLATASVAVAEWGFLAWQYAHGGVASHHLFARADMPAISNGWGGMVLPLMTWFLLGRVRPRVMFHGDLSRRYALIGFTAAWAFGVLLSVFFAHGNEQASSVMFQSIFLIAWVAPIYRAECVLGFVLGMAYTFGGVLPSIIGSVLALVALVIYRYIRTPLLRAAERLVDRVRRA